MDSQAGDVSDRTPLWGKSPLHVPFSSPEVSILAGTTVQALRNDEDIIKGWEWTSPEENHILYPSTLIKIYSFLLFFFYLTASMSPQRAHVGHYYRATCLSLRPALETSTIHRQRERKEIDIEIYTSDRDSHEHFHLGTHDADIPAPTSLHCDVSHALHVAVKPGPDQTTSPEDSTSELSETDSDSESQVEHDTRRLSHSSASSARARLARVVSWSSIVRSQCRWTNEQEKQLLMAEKQLARCQKAWSSEQELWLAYVRLSFLVVLISNCAWK